MAILTGTAANDTLVGTANDDTLNGLTGADKMSGGDGNDRYFIDQAGDIVTELANKGTFDYVVSTFSTTLAANVEFLELAGGALNGTGNAGRNFLITAHRNPEGTMSEIQPHVSENEARAVAEGARETTWEAPSFLRELFLGKLDLGLIHPWPEPDAEEQQRGEKFLASLERFLREQVDAERIERDARIPEATIAVYQITCPPPCGAVTYFRLEDMRTFSVPDRVYERGYAEPDQYRYLF